MFSIRPLIYLTGILLATLTQSICNADDLNEAPPFVDGNATIRSPLGDSQIVIKTTNRLAGAVHSLRWNGKEFINSTDHGRQLQSASNFEIGGPMIPETFNPTEAGSVADHIGPTSSSRLLHLVAEGNRLQTTNQMAFWLPPDGNSRGNPAKNETILSDHLLTKRIEIGLPDLPQVIRYQVTFSLPVTEVHRYAQLETLTGYMPYEFDHFWYYDISQDQVHPISAGPGEQKWPLIFSTKDKAYAMACIAKPNKDPELTLGPTYGRFRFDRHRVMKWNCVFRFRSKERLSKFNYPFEMFVIVGDWELVTNGLRTVAQQISAGTL